MRYLILHINCPDQSGIIAQFTGILYEHGGNILNIELYRKFHQYLPNLCVDIILKTVDGRFLMVKSKKEPAKGKWPKCANAFFYCHFKIPSLKLFL